VCKKRLTEWAIGATPQCERCRLLQVAEVPTTVRDRHAI